MNKSEVVLALSVLGTIVTFMSGMALLAPNNKSCKAPEDFRYNTQVIESSDFYNVCDLFVVGISEDSCEINVSYECPDSEVFHKWVHVSKLRKVR